MTGLPVCFTLPLDNARELRLVPDRDKYALECWTRYEDGRAMMAGGLRLGPGELRLLGQVLRDALWRLERQEAVGSVPQADGAA